MSRRQKYFLKQKTVGLFSIIMCVISGVFVEDGGLYALIFLLAGLVLMFSKEMLIYDSYKAEIDERINRKEVEMRGRP